jgi:hypothetical protein
MTRHDETTEPQNGGSYIGNRPERAAETIPGGVTDDDERVAAHDTQSSGAGKRENRVEGRDDVPPAGHRERDPQSDG